MKSELSVEGVWGEARDQFVLKRDKKDTRENRVSSVENSRVMTRVKVEVGSSRSNPHFSVYCVLVIFR